MTTNTPLVNFIPPFCSLDSLTFIHWPEHYLLPQMENCHNSSNSNECAKFLTSFWILFCLILTRHQLTIFTDSSSVLKDSHLRNSVTAAISALSHPLVVLRKQLFFYLVFYFVLLRINISVFLRWSIVHYLAKIDFTFTLTLPVSASTRTQTLAWGLTK